MRLLIRPTFVNVPVTIIVWTDGGFTETEGHLTDVQIADRAKGRMVLTVERTNSAATHAKPGTLAA